MIKDLVFFPEVCRRVTDGTLWEASYPSSGPLEFEWYFRRIIKIWGPIWRRTGVIWRLKDEGDNFRKFEVVSWRHSGITPE